MSRNVLLILTPNPAPVAALTSELERLGDEIHVATQAAQGLALAARVRPDVILLDVALPDMPGLEALTRLLAADADARVVMLVDPQDGGAVEAMRAGAVDVLARPLAPGEARRSIERALAQRRLWMRVASQVRRDAREAGIDSLLGESAAMQALRANVRKLIAAQAERADRDPPAVLIVGEPGTGKAHLARAMHVDGSRGHEPFVEVRFAELPRTAVDAELFGFEKGADGHPDRHQPGLVEAAEHGTLVLDEVGLAEPGTQLRLLDLVEKGRARRLGGTRERRVHPRVVSTSSQPLDVLVREGLFRADLFFRLRIVELHLPPLRQRGDDVLLLARHFLASDSRQYRRPGHRLDDEAGDMLLRHAWPGNVRELRHVIRQAVLACNGEEVGARHLRLAPPAPATPTLDGADLNLERMERRLILRALEQTRQNVSAAARLLGISRDTLRYRLERHALRPGTPGEPVR